MAGRVLEQQPRHAEVLSISKPGEGRGSFQRYVAMAGSPLSADSFVDLAQSAHRRGTELGHSRTMAKGLVIPGAEHHLSNGSREAIPGNDVAAFPMGDLTFVMTGWNSPERGGEVDPATVRKHVDSAVEGSTPSRSGKHVRRAAGDYDLVSYIPSGMEESLLELWGDRFGWTMEGIKERQQRIDEEMAGVDSHDRTVFFTGVVKHEEHGSRLVAASTLETAVISGHVAGESTEWAADADEKGSGVGTAAVVGSFAQGVDAYEGHVPYTFFAELNTSTEHSDAAPLAVVVGRRTGLKPSDLPFSHVLTHHVGVGDSNPVAEHETMMEEGGQAFPLRSFSVEYLAPDAIANLYPAADRAYIHAVLNEGERSVTHAGYPRTRA